MALTVILLYEQKNITKVVKIHKKVVTKLFGYGKICL